MQKLRLSLDDLAVTTFTPRTQDAPVAGTVQAHDALVLPHQRQHLPHLRDQLPAVLLSRGRTDEAYQ
jgi:hypothetical protein